MKSGGHNDDGGNWKVGYGGGRESSAGTKMTLFMVGGEEGKGKLLAPQAPFKTITINFS